MAATKASRTVAFLPPNTFETLEDSFHACACPTDWVLAPLIAEATVLCHAVLTAQHMSTSQDSVRRCFCCTGRLWLGLQVQQRCVEGDPEHP